jgi:hypothetical protein
MLEGLAGSVIFSIVTLALGSGWFLLRRRRLLKLFRVSKDCGLTIYLSRLQILQGGAIDFHGTPRSFAGPVVTAAEAGAATVLGSIFEYLIPGLESRSGILKTLFTRDISVSVEPSPAQVSALPSDRTVVAVGSPGYNCVSEWIESALNPLIRFDVNKSSMLPQGLQSVTDPSQGMVQVLWDANHSRRVLYVAGLSEAGTAAALLYLGRKWDELRRNLGNRQTYACFVRLQNGEPTLLSTVHPN